MDWRVFYRVLEDVEFGKSIFRGRLVEEMHARAMMDLVKKARKRFEAGVAGEIMRTFRPLVCPYDNVAVFKGQGYLSLFFPTKGQSDVRCCCWMCDVDGL